MTKHCAACHEPLQTECLERAFQPILLWHFECAEQASGSSSCGFRSHVPKKKKNQKIVAVTHVIESPIQMQSLKQDMEFIMLQKERNVKYFQGRNNLTFYTMDCFKLSSATLKPVLSLTQQRVH